MPGLRNAMRYAAVVAAMAATVASPAQAADGAWLAGDAHVHTCFSHDSWCPGEAPSEETLYSNFASVEQRFLEAAAKGLDFLVITDHDDVRAWSDPAFGSHGVLGVRGYETSLARGHGQVIGVSRHHDGGGGDVRSIRRLARSIADDGGVLQANHPGYRLESPVRTCEDVGYDSAMHWRYGFAVAPDVIEVWNTTSPIAAAELFWECWLERGARIPAGSGSDTHGALTLQIGNPTLWVLARGGGEQAVVEAIREGRTTITRRAPAQGAMRLVLEGPDGAGIGDTVRPGSTVRVRADGPGDAGFVTVRANGRTLLERVPLPPAGIEVTAPRRSGWIRAKLHSTRAPLESLDPNCTPNPYTASSPFSPCTEDLSLLALTSPIYVGAGGR